MLKIVSYLIIGIILTLGIVNYVSANTVTCQCYDQNDIRLGSQLSCTSPCNPDNCGKTEASSCKLITTGSPGSTSGTRLTDPLGTNGNIPMIANRIISAALGLTGILAIVAFIWGGIEWMTSGGNQQRIQKGKTMMIWAVIGLVVIFGSYAIITFIFQALGASAPAANGGG